MWDHCYPCFRLLVTSPLGFKARVGSALFELCGGVCDIHSLRFTSGATPLLVYTASIAASRLPHMHVSAEVGCRDLNRRPPARQSDVLPTRPWRPAYNGPQFASHLFAEFTKDWNIKHSTSSPRLLKDCSPVPNALDRIHILLC